MLNFNGGTHKKTTINCFLNTRILSAGDNCVKLLHVKHGVMTVVNMKRHHEEAGAENTNV